MNIDVMIETVVIIFIAMGTILSLLSALGFIRLPDVYTRSHAGTKSITLGLLFILVAAFLYFWMTDGHISIRLILAIAFVFITAPVAGHLITRAAYRSGVQLAKESAKDELGDELEAEKKRHRHSVNGE